MKSYGNLELNEGSQLINASVAFGTAFPASANKGEMFFRSDLNEMFVYNNTTWISFVNKAGDTMTGSLSMPKASGTALKIEGTYGWADLIGAISPRTGGAAPADSVYYGTVRGWSFLVGDGSTIVFHIPHDYAPGTDMFIHAHWGHNGTAISGSFVLTLGATYAKGHQQDSFTAPIATTITVPSLNLTNTPRYFHRVDEIQLTSAGGSASLLDTSRIEVDGLIMLSYTMTTIPSITGGTVNAPFIFTIDLHYQSTGLVTKNRSPNFYA